MVINVGLVVHHKINLQNSVDLAAYYGAMKQAEMMNAIGHVNYQIRQSYKLLMFRYYQLGLAGDERAHPYRWNGTVGTISSNGETDTKSNLRSVFCMSYPPNSITPSNETTCKDLIQGMSVDEVQTPDLIGAAFSFLGFQTGIQAATDALNTKAGESCRRVGQQNWFGLARYLVAYKKDLANRKQFAIFLANQMSGRDPLDIEGQSVRTGVYKTLYKNLTPQNQDSLRAAFGMSGEGNESVQANFQILNSLATDQCGSTGAEDDAPKWLTEIPIFPYLRIIDTTCDSGAAKSYYSKAITLGNENSGPNYDNLIGTDTKNKMLEMIHEPTGEDPKIRLYKSSLGFEKNPWCMTYFGVKASTTPAIPFSPLGSVKLEARAYAKPFGGQIGPWYGTTWPQGQKQSVGEAKANKVDGMVPMRVDYGPISINPNDTEAETNLNPDYSRYVGDSVGQRSNLTLAYSSKAIHENGDIDFMWWKHILEEDYTNNAGANDPLAWNSTSPGAIPFMRNLEIGAVSPNQFDVSYYSIDPDFYNNYLVKLRKGYQGKTQIVMRGDLGSRLQGSDELQKFSVRDQILAAMDTTKNKIDFNSKLRYYASSPQVLLTGWQGKNAYDYSLDESRFGKCLKELPPNPTPDQLAAGGCIAGGRTGYSVKLVDGNYLKASDLELGGEGVVGPLLNPPPDNF